MHRTKRSKSRGTARKPTPTRDHPVPHAPPRRSTRTRISGTNLWPVTVMGFLLLGGLGVCVLGAVLATSVMVNIVAPGAWPTPQDMLFIAIGVVTLTVLLGAVLVCLTSFLYNHTARFSGGVEVTLTDDLSDSAPATQAPPFATRRHGGAAETRGHASR